MKKVLFLIISILISLQSFAQQTLVVANGTATGEFLPVYGYWMDANQHNQIIYPSSMVSSITGALIYKMSFYTSTNSSLNWGGASVIVSLASTPDSSFVTPAFDTSTVTQVYTGPISIINGILTLQFTTPYIYQGGNLLVDIVTTTSGNYESVNFIGTPSNNGGIYFLEYESVPVQVSFLPQTTLEYALNTPILFTYQPTHVLQNTATLRGSFYNFTSTNFGFEYMLSNSTNWTNATSVQASSNPMSEEIANLQPQTSYQYRTFAMDGGNLLYGDTILFTTIPTPDTLPYLCNFEDTTQNNHWIFYNGTDSNRWYIGTPGSNGPLGNGLFISSDQGVTATYDSSISSSVMASTFIQFNDAPEFTLSFDWLGMGGYWEGYVMAYLVPADIIITHGSTIPSIYSVTPQLMGYTSWQHYTALLGPQYANNSYQLIYLWYNESYGFGTNPPGMVDNIFVTPLTCGSPTNLTFSNVGTTSVQLTWHHSMPAPEFIVYYQIEGDPSWNQVSANDTTFLLNGLTPANIYNAFVKAVCSPGDTSYMSNGVNFTTLCLPETAPTISEPFLDGLPSSCWSIKSGVLPNSGNAILEDSYWVWGPRNTLSSSTIALNMYSDDCDFWLLTPSIDLGTASTLYQLDFDLAQTNYMMGSNGSLSSSPNARFVVLISTDNGVTWNNTGILKEWKNNSSNPFSSINNTLQSKSILLFDSVAMAPYSGIVRFAFYGHEYDPNLYHDNDIHIDNFQVVPFNACTKPTNLSAVNITLTTSEINWTENGSATQWEIEYGPSGFMEGTGTFVLASNHPFTISNLTPSTLYDFHVRSVCGAGDTSYWSNRASFTTLCQPNPLPFTETFNTASFPSCWTQTRSAYIQSDIWSVVDYGATGGSGYEMITEMYTGFGTSRLISPPIDFTGTPYVTLSFKQLYLDEDALTSLKIQTSSDLINWVDQPYTFQIGGGLVGPETATVLMNMPTGVHYVAWTIIGDHELIGWAIDDVSIEETSVACLPPTNLQVEYIHGYLSEATWTPGGSETSWQIDYTLAFSANWTTAITTTPSYQLTYLDWFSNYKIRVKAICDESESPFTPEFDFWTNKIDENRWSQLINLFPNPTTSILTIQLSPDSIQVDEGIIYDMYGKQVKRIPIHENATTVNVSELSSGLYVLQFKTKQGNVMKKFVKK